MNLKGFCLVLLFANTAVRLPFLRQIANPIEITLALTSPVMLIGILLIIFLPNTKATLVATVAIGITVAFDLYQFQFVTPWLSASLSSFALVVLQRSIRKNIHQK